MFTSPLSPLGGGFSNAMMDAVDTIASPRKALDQSSKLVHGVDAYVRRPACLFAVALPSDAMQLTRPAPPSSPGVARRDHERHCAPWRGQGP